MAELRLGDQLARYDRDATVAAYAQLQHGDAESCGCAGCRNFIAVRAQAFPDAFRTFLAELGIDPSKEGEPAHQGPIGDNLHFYEGWFYLVGELIEVGERLVKIGEGFQYCFSSSFSPRPAVFGSEVAAVDFTARIPWVLDKPYDPFEPQMRKAEEIMARYPNALRDLAK